MRQAGKTPIWNQTFLFNINSISEDNLKIDAYDEDPVVDDYIGSAELKVKTLAMLSTITAKLIEKTVAVHDKEKVFAGEIDIQFKFEKDQHIVVYEGDDDGDDNGSDICADDD